MQRNFSADIHIKISKQSKNIVSIIPFSDSDRHIAKVIEKVLNQYLETDSECDLDLSVDDCFRRMTSEIRY